MPRTISPCRTTAPGRRTKVKKSLLVLLAFLAMESSVLWLSPQSLGNMLPPIVADTPSSQHYNGPGDVTSFTAWWGLRSYSSTTAAAAANVADLRRTSDNATCTVKLLPSTGWVDLVVGTVCNSSTQTATAWATRRTFTGAAISGTSLTFTGSAGSSASGDQIIGTGITTLTTISGACTTSPCTITPSQTVASTTITELIPVSVSKIYDQTAGNGCGGSSCDLVQATSASQPSLLFSGCGGTSLLPCLRAIGTTGAVELVSANNFTPSSPLSLAVVANRTSGTQTHTLVTANSAASSNDTIASFTANKWNCHSIAPTANDAAWHSTSCVLVTTPSTSTFNVDGTETTSGALTVSTAAGKPGLPRVGAFATGTVLVGEGGFKGGTAWSSTQRTNICHNQYLAWGTATSC